MRRMNIVEKAAVVATHSNPTPQATPTAAESLFYRTKPKTEETFSINIAHFD